MTPEDRLEAILSGKFLSLQTELPIKSKAGNHHAAERVPVTPRYDPQGSTAVPMRHPFIRFSQSPITYEHHARTQKSSMDTFPSELPIRPLSRRGKLRLSITPAYALSTSFSLAPRTSGIEGYDQSKIPSMDWIEPPKNEDLECEPPDGGYIAWLQTVAGFLVTFNAL
ncbi:MAG: hypothetical protein Q9190_001354 [Brigantiaea leucoxantha]